MTNIMNYNEIILAELGHFILKNTLSWAFGPAKFTNTAFSDLDKTVPLRPRKRLNNGSCKHNISKHSHQRCWNVKRIEMNIEKLKWHRMKLKLQWNSSRCRGLFCICTKAPGTNWSSSEPPCKGHWSECCQIIVTRCPMWCLRIAFPVGPEASPP